MILRDFQASADELQASVISLLTELVRIPSRAGVDPYEAVFDCIIDWLRHHHIACTPIAGANGRTIAVAGRVGSLRAEGGTIVLNASVDTAGFGDLTAWSHEPLGAEIVGSFLYGRGSADAKAGISIFCHLLAAFRTRTFANGLGFLFDADEHTGSFGGVRAWLDNFNERIAGVLIGYPGHDQVGVGARGFWRATLHVSGASAHSGSSKQRGINAIAKAAELVTSLAEHQREMTKDSAAFPLPPKFTITGIRGGGEFSIVPDACEVDVDVRLTPAFAVEAAETCLQTMIQRLDAKYPSPTRSRIVTQTSLPAYLLPRESPLPLALNRASKRILNRELPFAVTGPSNIGNLLAQRGIPATCGFGVAYRNIHAADECVDLASVTPTYRVYEAALQELLSMA